MAALIFDASGIVKRYLVEAGTSWVQGLADPAAANEIFLTRITRVEITAAVTRRGRGGAFHAQAMPRPCSGSSATTLLTSTTLWRSPLTC